MYEYNIICCTHFVMYKYIRLPGNAASIPHKVVQRLSPGRSFAVVPYNCHSDTVIEDAKFGSKRYEELSPDFEPLLHVEGRGENRRLSEYFTANSLLPQFQSGFRRRHSTESALLRVLSDIFSATDKGEVNNFWPCSTSVLQLTLWIIRSWWTDCPFRMDYRARRSTGCNASSSVVHRLFILVVQSQGVHRCDLELPRDQYWV